MLDLERKLNDLWKSDGNEELNRTGKDKPININVLHMPIQIWFCFPIRPKTFFFSEKIQIHLFCKWINAHRSLNAFHSGRQATTGFNIVKETTNDGLK